MNIAHTTEQGIIMHSIIEKEKRLLGSVMALIALFAIFHIFKYTLGNDIWYDEVFSMSFAQKSFGDIVKLTSRDVHPPFYYFYLKIMTGIICLFIGSQKIVLAAKIASVLPWFGILALGITYIRKRFGYVAFGLFMLLITAMPQLPTYYLEIRMYSLSLFLITADIILAHYLYENAEKKNYLQWFLFFLTGILTAYTQYYSCIAIIGVYIALFFILLFKKNSAKKLSITKLLICSAASVILYLPWLPLLKGQMEHVSGSYWIQPLTLRSLAGCVKFIILPVVYLGKLPVISVVLSLGTIAILGFLFVRSIIMDKDKKSVSTAIICISPIVLVVLSGFILSALGTPIFIYRYLVATLGGLWLFVSIMAERAITRRPFVLLILPFLFTTYLSMKGIDAEEGNKLAQEKSAMAAIANIPESSVLITNFDHVTAVLGYYRPDCSVILYEGEVDKLLPDMLGNITDNAHDGDVLALVKDNSRDVYFLGSFNSREEIVAKWEEQGICNQLSDNVLVERYWINVYKLSGEKND
jgi:hypothetical protein